MDKKIIIGGGAVVVIGGLLFIRARNKAAVASAAAQGEASGMQTVGSIPAFDSTSYASSLPISGGSNSGSYSAPTDPTNSGSSATGGGFDFTALFGDMIKSNAAHATAQTQADATTADGAIIASILGGGSNISISHSGTTTSINKGDASDQFISQAYHEILGRDPDAAGLAYYKNDLMNRSLSFTGLMDNLKNSQEYKDKVAKDNAAAGTKK